MSARRPDPRALAAECRRLADAPGRAPSVAALAAWIGDARRVLGEVAGVLDASLVLTEIERRVMERGAQIARVDE